jgi:hypothetical protein
MIFIILFFAGVISAPFLYNFFLLPSLPGPLLAKFTDLWRLLAVRGGNAQEIQLNLHKSLGNIVRIGPNCVSLSGYDAIKGVYAIGQKLPKVNRISPSTSNYILTC